MLSLHMFQQLVASTVLRNTMLTSASWGAPIEPRMFLQWRTVSRLFHFNFLVTLWECFAWVCAKYAFAKLMRSLKYPSVAIGLVMQVRQMWVWTSCLSKALGAVKNRRGLAGLFSRRNARDICDILQTSSHCIPSLSIHHCHAFPESSRIHLQNWKCFFLQTLLSLAITCHTMPKIQDKKKINRLLLQEKSVCKYPKQANIIDDMCKSIRR